MSKERRIERLLDKYNDLRDALKHDYELKMKDRTVNEAGEVSAEETLEINMWYVEEQNELNNQFIKELKEV